MLDSEDIIKIQIQELIRKHTHFQKKLKIAYEKYEDERDIPELEECIATIAETLDMVSSTITMIENPRGYTHEN
jgi:hypothetical protein